MLQQGGRRLCEGTAMGAIALDLRPGLGIGSFSLGMPICEAFAQIEQHPNIYDVVHVKYLDEDPLKLDIVISFPDHGFHLRFDPLSQGLSFSFPISSQYTECCYEGEAELPLEFPDGTTPVTCRVSVYDSAMDKKVGVGLLMDKASVPPLPTGSLYMEEVHVKLGQELHFYVGGQHIPFGASPQDVCTELGRPCGVHQKQELNVDKKRITPSTKWEQVKEILGDCGRAAIQTQGSSSNPFGSTFVYGYQNIAFEVMKNGYIATVTLFKS